MATSPEPKRKFHLHLISDATGETLYSVAKASCAQLDGTQPIEHVYSLVRSVKQLDRALLGVAAEPGIVMCTMMNTELRGALEERCRDLGQPCIHVLDQVLTSLGAALGAELTHKTGGQHEMDAEYFRRMEALNFTMHHDDGQMAGTLEEADVVLIGFRGPRKPRPASIWRTGASRPAIFLWCRKLICRMKSRPCRDRS